MKENINNADNVLERLSIIEKARALSWYEDLDFEKSYLVNVLRPGYGTERFFITGATIEGVMAYPKTDLYGPQDADYLETWCNETPSIERDNDSRELESFLDERLRATGIDKDNPLVTNDYRFFTEPIAFEGIDPTI